MASDLLYCSPSKAINRLVLPLPVAPITRLISPRRNLSSLSIFRAKLRFDGVNEPLLFELDQVKEAWLNPIVSGSNCPSRRRLLPAGEDSSPREYLSNNSVFEPVLGTILVNKCEEEYSPLVRTS